MLFNSVLKIANFVHFMNEAIAHNPACHIEWEYSFCTSFKMNGHYEF